MSTERKDLVGGGRLARNVVWSLLGAGAPMIVALVAIPLLIEGLGKARFGVLTIAWMVVGYFSLFDLGLGRALTKLVAEKLGRGETGQTGPLIRLALGAMLVLGTVGAALIALLCPWLVGAVLKIPADLQPETLRAFYLLSVSVPVVIVATGLRGVLEAHQEFGLINLVRIPLGVLTFLGPLAVLPFSHSLVPVVGVLVAGRLVAILVYTRVCLRVEPRLLAATSLPRSQLGALLSFGGWMTVTNIVGPLMVYLDRFLIGATISMTSVAYYTTPYEIVSRLRIVPTALMRVLFPAFATALGEDRARAARVYRRAVRYLFLLLFPVILILVTFASEGFRVWLGPDFALNSARVLQLLAIGVLINSHAHIPFGLVQSAGRPDLTAKLHLAELPVYLVLLWWLVSHYGILGAAVAWVVRAVLDAAFLFALAGRLLGSENRSSGPAMWSASLTLIVLAASASLAGLAVKVVFVVVVLVAFCGLGWRFVLRADERVTLRSRLASRAGSAR